MKNLTFVERLKPCEINSTQKMTRKSFSAVMKFCHILSINPLLIPKNPIFSKRYINRFERKTNKIFVKNKNFVLFYKQRPLDFLINS